MEFYYIIDLIEKLKNKGYKIGIYPASKKSWIDVGQWEEYKQTIESFSMFDM